ncbi:MAG: hypothetical protein ABW087_15775, partial [Candidatus Thiodiazotropha sp.]
VFSMFYGETIVTKTIDYQASFLILNGTAVKQCTKCGTFWEYHPGSYPNTLTKEEAFEYFGFKKS